MDGLGTNESVREPWGKRREELDRCECCREDENYEISEKIDG